MGRYVLRKRSTNIVMNDAMFRHDRLHDDAPSPKVQFLGLFLKSEKVTVLSHLSWSSDLAPCDFFIFLNIKNFLSGRRYMFREKWIQRLKSCISNSEEYFYLNGCNVHFTYWSNAIEISYNTYYISNNPCMYKKSWNKLNNTYVRGSSVILVRRKH